MNPVADFVARFLTKGALDSILARLKKVPWWVWAGLAAAILLAAGWMLAEHKGASSVRTEQTIANADARTDTADARTDSNKAIAKRTDDFVEQNRQLEHVAAKVKADVAAHPAADQPIDPDLARTWLAGLRELRGESEAGAGDRVSAAGSD